LDSHQLCNLMRSQNKSTILCNNMRNMSNSRQKLHGLIALFQSTQWHTLLWKATSRKKDSSISSQKSMLSRPLKAFFMALEFYLLMIMPNLLKKISQKLGKKLQRNCLRRTKHLRLERKFSLNCSDLLSLISVRLHLCEKCKFRTMVPQIYWLFKNFNELKYL